MNRIVIRVCYFDHRLIEAGRLGVARMRKRSRALSAVALASALALVTAACGDDDDTGSGAATTTGGAETTEASGATTTEAGGATTSAADGATTTAAGGGEGAVSPACEPDESIDATEGKNAGQFTADLLCAQEKPLKAEGEPIVIGFQNHQGDPAGSFPEYTAAIEAATKYINEELGGFGGNPSTGTPGRPIQLETCFMAVNPADSQRCANELSGKEPFAVLSGSNFFGNHVPIYDSANIPLLIGSPITIADFTGTGFAVGTGGGCLGVHTALVYAATQELGGTRVAVPWADTPPGVVCYYDLEKKPLDVLNGTTPGDSELAGSMPDLEHIGVPIKPATPDVTPQVTQVLDFDPDVIIWSGQGADCWNLVDGLGRAGWTPQDIPLIFSGPCIDFEKMEAAGDLAKGIYFISSAGANLANPDTISNPRMRLEAETYVEKAAEYGMPAADITKGYGTQGWSLMLTAWEQAGIVVNEGKELTPETFAEQVANTQDNHINGSVPFGCQDAPPPYTAVCNSKNSLVQWDGEELKVVIPVFSGVELLTGTELQPGP
jgi:branched-chain amino acid transport system substrate-binding protein